MSQLLFNKRTITPWLKRHAELICWVLALFTLFFLNTDTDETSLCIFRFMGFNNCPGCGLGHAIHCVLHLQFSQSFHYHPFGIPAVLIILSRVKHLSFSKKTIIYEV